MQLALPGSSALCLSPIAIASLLPPVALAQPAAIEQAIRSTSPQFNGTVLVTKRGRTIFHGSFGLANRQFEVPNTNTTKFKIASITKLLTSVMTLQLHEEGRLSLQTPIAGVPPSLWWGRGGAG